jgi:hypothetical protein
VVTQGNLAALSLLAKEFCPAELLSECSALSFDLVPSLSERVSHLEREIDPVPSLSERVSHLEREIVHCRTRPLEARLAAQEKGLNSLSSRYEELAGKLSRTIVAISGNESTPLKPLLSLCEEKERLLGAKALRKVEIPMKAAKSSEGIISYLTKSQGGSIHGAGVMTITSQSVGVDPRNAVKNVVGLSADSAFRSGDGPGQWVRWDFHEMRVRPTHYTLKGAWLKSWVVEGSVDGESWTEIDRQTDRWDFSEGWATASFTVPKPGEFRFVRLTQTDTRHLSAQEHAERPPPRYDLNLGAVEFFGTLSE